MTLSRREFSKLSATALAAHLLRGNEANAQNSQATDQKTGYCVIGLGRIADHFMRGVQQSSNSTITAVVSGHPDKAAKIAAQYGIPATSIYSYEDMDRIRDNKAIDAVYVALPNNMHAEYTIRSAKAGKHVLCEKPMSTTVADAEAMIAACKAANVKLMIAYRLHFDTWTLRAIKLIRDGAIGDIQTVTGSFGFNCAPGEWRLSKKYAGGGPLMDVGIYVVNASRYLTGQEPTKFAAVSSVIDHDGRFKDVEENISWTATFPSGILATGNSSYGTQMQGFFKAFGTRGQIEMDPAYNYDGLRLRATYEGPKGSPQVMIDEPSPDRDPVHFGRQADHLAECIRTNQTPKTPGEEGLRDMQYLRAIYASAGITMGS